MNVLHVWDYEYPWDVRVEKVSSALTAAGHQVHLAARNRNRGPGREVFTEATVHRIGAWRFLPRALDGALQFPVFFNPRWSHLLRRTAAREACEVVLVRDLPLAPTAVHVARGLRLPVILDMAENYPAMMRDLWTHRRARPMDYLVRNPAAVQAVERYVLRHVHHVLVVVEEARDRLLRMGVERDRITIVSNTPPASRLSVPRTEPGRAEGALTLGYLGLMEVPRGIHVVLDALALLRDRGVPCRLDLVGGGRDLDLFRARARRLGLGNDHVTFHGFLPYPQGLAIMEQADVGLVPHLAGEFWDTTVPNKLFDYMAAGIPVLASDARPTDRIVRDARCGAVFASGDPASLAAAVEAMRDPCRRSDASRAGRDAVRRTHNWERDSHALVTAVERTVSWFRSARRTA